MLFYLNIELLISKGSHQDNSRAFEFESYLNILLRQLHFAPHMYPIEKNPKVCFEMECDVVPFEGKVACQYGNSYSCVVGKGKAVIVEDVNEKMQALSILMKCQTGGDFTFNEELVSIVNVIRIDVSEFSAKRRPVPEGLKK